MIKVENVDVWGFEHAIRGGRNPMNSWSKSDSYWWDPVIKNDYVIGENDLDLMRRLYKAGTEHRKYLRQIFVSMDITSNHVFWAEADTYKIGVTRNSCSKMHKIHAIEFRIVDFSHEGIDEVEFARDHFEHTLTVLEQLRNLFNDTKDKKYWRAIIELLPMGYNLKSTVTMNYENVVNIIKQRSEHKLQEWNDFVEELKKLPYIEEIISE